MRALLIAAAVVLLSSCASFDEPVRTSTNLNGQSFHSMDMTDPHFYMNEDSTPSNSAHPVQPIPRYGIDGYCGYCQSP